MLPQPLEPYQLKPNQSTTIPCPTDPGPGTTVTQVPCHDSSRNHGRFFLDIAPPPFFSNPALLARVLFTRPMAHHPPPPIIVPCQDDRNQVRYPSTVPRQQPEPREVVHSVDDETNGDELVEAHELDGEDLEKRIN